MSSPSRGGQNNQPPQSSDPLAGRSSSPLAFPSSSPSRASGNAAPGAANGSSPANSGAQASGSLRVPGNNPLLRSSSPLAFPSSSPRREAQSQTATPQAGNRAGNPLFAPGSADRGSLLGSALRNARNSSSAPGSDAAPPSSEPLFFPSSATPKARRRGDIHSSLPLSASPSPLRRRGAAGQDGQAAGGAPSSSAPDGNGSIRSGAAGRGGAPPSLSNVGLSSDAVEENERNQGARTVIWNTAVSLDETMSSFKMFLQEFKAKYRTEYARKLGKPLPFVPDPERPVYEH